MNKRILIFSTAYIPLIGGAEIAVREITKRIPQFNFVLITAKIDSSLKDYEKIENVEVYRIGVGNFFDKFRLFFYGVKKAESLGKFDLVWSIMASYSGFTSLRFKKKFSKTPMLLTLQEGDSKLHIYKRVWWCWFWFKQIFQSADKIQVISSFLGKWAKSLGGRDIEIVPNGVDFKKIAQPLNAEDYKRKVKEKLGIKLNDKIIFSVSRLVKKNGLEDLIGAMNFLPKNYHLIIAGKGGLEERLKAVSKKFAGRVRFLGEIEYNMLPIFLWSSDVFCRPSLSEGLGNSFLEAMVAEVPVIGTKVGGIPDFLLDNETGLFCEVNNSKDIAEKIQKIVETPELAEKIKINAKNLIEKKYTWDIVSKKMKGIFDNLVKEDV